MRWRLVLILSLSGLLVASASVSVEATYPGTNDGRLAFGMIVGGNADIYSVLPNGNDLRQLTTDSSFDACASYSPDGKEIAFCSTRSGVSEIWKMKQNGTQQEQVTHLGGNVTFPDFSPDGSRIAFGGSAGGSHPHLWIVNSDRGGPVAGRRPDRIRFIPARQPGGPKHVRDQCGRKPKVRRASWAGAKNRAGLAGARRPNRLGGLGGSRAYRRHRVPGSQALDTKPGCLTEKGRNRIRNRP